MTSTPVFPVNEMIICLLLLQSLGHFQWIYLHLKNQILWSSIYVGRFFFWGTVTTKILTLVVGCLIPPILHASHSTAILRGRPSHNIRMCLNPTSKSTLHPSPLVELYSLIWHSASHYLQNIVEIDVDKRCVCVCVCLPDTYMHNHTYIDTEFEYNQNEFEILHCH